MRVPLSWLREFVDTTLSPEELADKLTLVGLEVAGIDYVGVQPPSDSPWSPDLTGAEPPAYIPWNPDHILVGEILEVQQHPNAERLTIPRIGYGDGREISVVTGAPNIKVGMQGQKVVLALNGSRLIDGHSEVRRWITLKPTKLRGVPSEGMVCSELELGLSDEHEGIILLPDDAPVGTPLVDYLGDVVLEIETTPNYAHTLSILGVAREVAALTGSPLRQPKVDLNATGAPIEGRVKVEVEDASICPRFVAGLIEGVKIGPSPLWMQHRLRLAGVRSINNVADVTNYVMLEYGEPSHAFDADQVHQRHLIIRPSQIGEVLETLDHVKRELRPIDTVVADPQGPSSLAGVMGGAASEISDGTVNVLYEAALWHPVAIRRTAGHFRLQSEASRRFEKGVDPALPPLTVSRGLQLIQQLAGGTIAQGLIDVLPEPVTPLVLELPIREVRRVLGIDLSLAEVQGFLEQIHFTCEPLPSGDALRVTVPTFRRDVEIVADLLEEVARMYGYDRIPETLMADELPPQRANTDYELAERIRDLLASSTLDEAITYSLTNPTIGASLDLEPQELPADQWVTLENPLTPERVVMRRDILPELVQVAVSDLRERERVALFELGAVFFPVKGQRLPDEPRRIAFVLAGNVERLSWLHTEPRKYDFFDGKGLIEELLRRLNLSNRAIFVRGDDSRLHPGRSAKIVIDGESMGVLGELHPVVRERLNIAVPRVVVAELNLDALIRLAEPTRYRPIWRNPATVQDVALLASDEIPAATIAATITKYGGEYLEDVRLFDVYTGAPIPSGQRSLAFRLRFRASDRTLADKELAKTREKLLKSLERELGVQIRG